MSLVLRCLSRLPFEPLKLASYKHFTRKTSYLLALALARRVRELHNLFFLVRHLRSWSYCTSPFFLTSWLRPRILEEFSVPPLDNFVGGDWDELLLCPIKALRKYLTRTEQYRPGIEGLFISTGRRKKWVSCNTISFWLLSVITLAYVSASEEDCRSLRVRAHEVRKVATSVV